MTQLPELIADEETLGRAVFDREKAKRAARDGTIHPKAFREAAGILEISTDRLAFNEWESIARFHDQTRNRECLGWAVVAAAKARLNKRTVDSDPIPGNPYHAFITLPSDGEEIRDIQQTHAVELASAARWLSRPVEPEASPVESENRSPKSEE